VGSAAAARERDAQRIVAAGELDMATAPLVEARVHAARAGHVVLDLRDVTFIDSGGLRAVIEAHEMLGERLTIMPSECRIGPFEIIAMVDRLPLIHD
jgi:anti-anti-sigma factor